MALLVLKFTKLLMSFSEPRVSFSSKFASLFGVMRHLFCAFSSRTLYTLDKKKPIKVQIFRLSTARMKTNQISHVIFQVTSQFSVKFWIVSQCHNTYPLKFPNWNIIFFGQKEPTKVQFFRLLSALMKSSLNSSCYFWNYKVRVH